MTTILPYSTLYTAPLAAHELVIWQQQADIETWFAQAFIDHPPPLYCSVDLRQAGFKLAAVDTNLFPAGFNNLPPTSQALGVPALQATLQRSHPNAKRVLLIPENHTRNRFYFEHLNILKTWLNAAGYQVTLGHLDPALTEPQTHRLTDESILTTHPIIRQDNTLHCAGQVADLIILNNDCSDGIPTLLTELAQPIRPALSATWATRLKSEHFQRLKTTTQAFATQFALDPWRLCPLFRNCGAVDFMQHEGEQCLVHNSHLLLKAIRQKYAEYHIDTTPFVAVKADAGTYGMAVMMVDDAEQLRALNRKQRTRMANRKGGQSVSKVILQEGVPTLENWGSPSASAEPVLYMVGEQIVGSFYRVNARKDPRSNLNAPGMHFVPFPEHSAADADPRFYSMTVLARLALLSAAQERAPT